MTTDGERIATDDAGAAALATVLRIAEEGDGTVAWTGVEDELAREWWGAMLDDGVLVSADGGGTDDEGGDGSSGSDGRDDDRFVIADPTALRETLAARDREFAPPEPEGWSRIDVAAAVGVLALLVGYRVELIWDTIGAGLDFALGPLAAVLPFPAVVLVLAVATTVAARLVRRWHETPELDGLRHRTRELRARLGDARARGDDAAAARLDDRQRELAGRQVRVLTDHLKVLTWTMVLTVPVVLYLSWLVTSPARATAPLVTVAPVLGEIVWTARVVGPMQAWMTWYALCSIAATLAAQGVERVVPDRIGATT